MTAPTLDIRGGTALLPDGPKRADVRIRDGRIEAIGDVETDRRSTTIDATDRLVTAGLVDLQCNGAGGIDVTRQPDRIDEIGAVLTRFGITSFLPTVVTAPRAQRDAAIAAFGSSTAPRQPGARPLGLHFEGPALSPSHLGAHDATFRRGPTAISDEIVEWASSDVVRMVTLAPELDGADTAIRTLVDAGVLVFAGHTAMTPGDLAAAKRAGLRGITHLFNAMAPFGHRTPGPIGALLADDDLAATIICDGVHVDPVVVRAAWRALGPHRVALVSDSSAPLGEPYGRFRLGRRELIHDETGVRTDDGVLAGSALSLDQAVRNLRAFADCDWTEAVAAATAVPADLLGRDDIGRLALGACGDVVVFDHDLRPQVTIVGGTIAHRAAADPTARAGAGTGRRRWRS